MSNHQFPGPPLVPGANGGAISDDELQPGLIEHDGEVTLDPDIDDALVDGADADRIASGADPDDPP